MFVDIIIVVVLVVMVVDLVGGDNAGGKSIK